MESKLLTPLSPTCILWNDYEGKTAKSAHPRAHVLIIYGMKGETPW